MPSFKKSLIVEQFQGNYLEESYHMSVKVEDLEVYFVLPNFNLCLFQLRTRLMMKVNRNLTGRRRGINLVIENSSESQFNILLASFSKCAL